MNNLFRGLCDMMYNTHEQVAKAFYAASIPIGVTAGILPDMVTNFDKGITGTVIAAGIFITSLYVGYKGAIFGAGYPDLDCEGSIPDKRYPIIGKIMRGLGATHRGKYSHSLDSLTLTWLIALLIVKYGIGYFGMKGVEPEIVALLGDGSIVNNLLQIWVLSAWVGCVSHLFADASTKSGIRIFFFMDSFRLVPNHKFFKTGKDSLWESIFRKVFYVVTPLSLIISLYIIF